MNHAPHKMSRGMRRLSNKVTFSSEMKATLRLAMIGRRAILISSLVCLRGRFIFAESRQ
jgi:hypothetical protein